MAALSVLRAHSPSAGTPPPTVPIPAAVIFDIQLQVEGGVSLAVNVRDIEFPEFGTAAEREAARAQALSRLRSVTSGLRSSFDTSRFSDLIGTVPPILNAGLAVDEPGSGAPATFLQVGIQLEPQPTPVDDLTAARLAETTSSMLRNFYAGPVSRRGSAAWCIWVKAGLLEQGAVERTTRTLGRESSRLWLRGQAVAIWPPPATDRPHGALFIQAPITVLNACGTNHHINVGVDASAVPTVSRANTLQLDLHFDYHTDGWELAGCGLEIGLITGSAGFVAGGVFGGWIGAIIGAIAGFVIGFVGVIIFAFAFAPELDHLDGGCEHGATSRDIRCQQEITFGSDLLSGLVIDAVVGFTDGIVLSGVLNAVRTESRPLSEAVVGAQLRWGHLSRSTNWGLLTDIQVVNRGGGKTFIGPVVAIGDGASVWNGHFMVPSAPVYGGAVATIRLEVPRQDVENARSSGPLLPPEVLIFTTAGSRVVRFRSVPDPIRDEDINQAEFFSKINRRIGALEQAFVRMIPPFPPEPHWMTINPAITSILQILVRDSQPDQRLVLASENGQILAMTRIDKNGDAALDVMTKPFEGHVLLLRVEDNVADADVAYDVSKRLEKTPKARAQIAGDLRTIFRNAIVEDKLDDKGEVVSGEDPKGSIILSVAGLFDVLVRKVDLVDVEKALDTIARESNVWPGEVIGRRAAAVSARLTTGSVVKDVRVREVKGRRLVDIETARGTRSLDFNRLQMPVLSDLQSEPPGKSDGETKPGWWRNYGFIQVTDRLIGPAAQLPGHLGEEDVVVLSLLE